MAWLGDVDSNHDQRSQSPRFLACSQGLGCLLSVNQTTREQRVRSNLSTAPRVRNPAAFRSVWHDAGRERDGAQMLCSGSLERTVQGGTPRAFKGKQGRSAACCLAKRFSCRNGGNSGPPPAERSGYLPPYPMTCHAPPPAPSTIVAVVLQSARALVTGDMRRI